MTARGSADTPATPDGAAQAAATTGPVLSLEEAKAERARQQAAPAVRPAPAAPAAIPATAEPVEPTPAAPAILAKPAPAAATPAPKAAAQPGSSPTPPKPATAAPASKPAPAAPKPAAATPSSKQAPAKPAAPAAPAPRPAAPAPQVFPKPARPARARRRHWLVVLSFLLLVLGPTAAVAWYLWERASPRFASEVGFSVRTEELGSAMDFLGGIASFAGGSSSKDTDILYRFIQSQEIVAAIDARLDLRSLWAKGDPVRDPVYAYDPPGTIEDLHDHWQSMVSVYNDTGTGLLDIEVQAFAPEDARAIAMAIYAESQILINRLSDIAQEDRTRHALEDLDAAEQRLTEARVAMTRFRNETQIVDPVTALQGQMGLLNALETQLAQTQIDLDLLSSGDPRVTELESRVTAIQARMEEERAKLGLGRSGSSEDGLPDGGDAFADLVGRYEQLAVEQEFAQQAYVAALAAYDKALAEGRQQSRYLAAHVEPTMAERADYPKRWTLTLLTALFATLAWLLITLTGYALRDRR